MDIKLDEHKIVKIVYRLNDKTTVDFNYKNGEIESITNNNDKTVLTDSEMIKLIKKSKFMSDLEEAKAKHELANKTEELSKITEESTKQNEQKLSKALKNAKKLINMDINGEIDDILKIMDIDNSRAQINELKDKLYETLAALKLEQLTKNE